MGLQRRDSIVLSKSELELFKLIKEGVLGPCTHLMDQKEINIVLKTQRFEGEFTPYTLAFSSPKLSFNELSEKKTYKLVCEAEVVGSLELKEKFQIKGDIKSIFNPNFCYIDETMRTYIAGDFELKASKIKDIKQDFLSLKAHLKAQKITAIIANLDPLHKAHERIFRWAIDNSDLIVIFLMESYELNGLDFELKKRCLEKFVDLYLPKERIFIFPLKDLSLFNAHLNVILEAKIAKNIGCNQIVVGQNHAGLGLFYEDNKTKTVFDELAKNFGIEVTVLPEFVYCNQCKISVSTHSCPHGPSYHIKFHTNSLKELLKTGIIPPTIFMRREISALILSYLFPNRFKNIQMIYNDLFPHVLLPSKKIKDEDLYEQLISMYQLTYMV